jgi:ribosomal protein L29
MEEKIHLSLDEKRKLLFFLKLNAQAKTLKDRSLVAKIRKEIARETSKSSSEKEKLG